MIRVAMQTQMRAAAVSLLESYAASVAPAIKLQVYPGRPRTLYPPSAFVDAINEPIITYTGLRQRLVQAEVVLVHGLFDSAETVAHKDQFMDEFLDWVTDHHDEAANATLTSVVSTQDVPNFVPDWMPEEEQLTYYATRITLEGLTLDRN